MNQKKRLTISLSENIFAQLEKMAKEKGLSKSGMIAVLVDSKKDAQK